MTITIDRDALRYLKETAIEKLALEMREQGYAVEPGERAGDAQFDLVARKDGKVIAVEAMVRTPNGTPTDEIAQRRLTAFAVGFNEFRLLVINPSHNRDVRVAGLDAQLRNYWQAQPSHMLGVLLPRPRAIKVDNLLFDAVDVTSDGIRVQGWATVTVQINRDTEQGESAIWAMDLPFAFDALLTHDLHLREMRRATIEGSDSYMVF